MKSPHKPFNTPIALCVYKREEKTRRIINILRSVKPRNIFIFGDGPKPNSPDDLNLINRTRSVVSEIDWECHIKTNWSEINLGGPRRVPSGLDWAFNYCDKLIYLEDDIVFSSDYLYFADKMLSKFEDDEDVLCVSCRNPLHYRAKDGSSYFFSSIPNFGHSMAIWKRSWLLYDESLKTWENIIQNGGMSSYIRDNKLSNISSSLYSKIYSNVLPKAWDHIFSIAFFCHKGKAIVPSYHLVEADGFDEHGQHMNKESAFRIFHIDKKLESMPFPLIHPSSKDIDYYFEKIMRRRKHGLKASINKYIQIVLRKLKKLSIPTF